MSNARCHTPSKICINKSATRDPHQHLSIDRGRTFKTCPPTTMSSDSQGCRPFGLMSHAHDFSVDKMNLQNAGHDLYDNRHTTINHNQAPSSTFNFTTNAPNSTVYNGNFTENEFHSGHHGGYFPLQYTGGVYPVLSAPRTKYLPHYRASPRYIPHTHPPGFDEPHFSYYAPPPSPSEQWRGEPRRMRELWQKDSSHVLMADPARTQIWLPVHGEAPWLHLDVDPRAACQTSRPCYPW